MERTGILAGAVADGAAALEAGVTRIAAVLLDGGLLEGERALQQVAREVMSALESRVLAGRAGGPQGEAGPCLQCGGRLHLVGRERERTVLGLVGEYRFARSTFYCARCHACHSPLDAVLGLGEGQLSPGLAQVVCAEAQKDSFGGARKSVESSLSVVVAEETVRRTAEGLGRLIEQDQADRQQWQVPDDGVPARVLVEVDGVSTPLRDGYHEAKVGRVGVLGPKVQEDPETGRLIFELSDSTFCVGLEACDPFFERFAREAWRAGCTRGVPQIICLSDGARWIWARMQAQFGLPGVEVVEIVDFRHASEHLADVARAVFGQGTLQATTWWAAHRHTLLHQGAAPILTDLAALLTRPDLDEAARDEVRRNYEEYFRDNQARMDYPRFVARQFPIGSGAVESACKTLITQRHKGAGMRWSAPGAQEIANLRALYRSAHQRWDAFWASCPLARLRVLGPRPAVVPAAAASPGQPEAASAAQPCRTPVPTVAAPVPPALDASDSAPVPVDRRSTTAAAPPRPTPARTCAIAGKPWAKGRDYWRRQPVCRTRSA
jgi:hypothetical protein